VKTETPAIPSPTGTTRRYAVIGNPVEQVMAPSLMNRRFVDRGIDAVLVPIKADTAFLADDLKSFANLDGSW
jgi:shikimate dehydrogenase